MLLSMPGVSQSIHRANVKGITLSYDSVPLITILKDLRDRTGYYYMLDADFPNIPVTIHVANAKLQQVFNILSARLPIICFSRDSVIFIQRKPITYVNRNILLGEPVINRVEVLPIVTVNTGYQYIPVNQATGSFKQASMQQVTGIPHFNLQEGFENNLSGYLPALKTSPVPSLILGSIRGKSTISSNPQPLVVIDDFPFYGDLNMLNPDDIESITVAKDAASTAIFGARAANGIIVMTTKKANWKQPFKISVNNFITCSNRPNVDYIPSIQPRDLVLLEENLFKNHFYAPLENLNVPLPPVIEALIDNKKGRITTAQLDSTLDVYKSQNIRSDIKKYYYRPAFIRHNGIQISGSCDSLAYAGSISNGRSSFNENGIRHDRTTMLGNMLYHHKKLSITTGLFYSGNIIQDNFVTPPAGPSYLRLADGEGNPLSVPYLYRSQYADTAGSNNLLDWHMRPLQELRNASNVSRYRYLMTNAKIGYQLYPSLQFQALYQFGSLRLDQRIMHNLETFWARNLINNFTQITTSGLERPIPAAPILEENETITHINNWRLQFNYYRRWKADELTMMGGAESQNTESTTSSRLIYGYRSPFAKTNLDYTFYPQYSNPGMRIQIPTAGGRSDSIDYYVSYFGNAFYTWSKKITLSLSLRQDRSNRFGMKVNQQLIPLWAAGILVQMHNFSFFPATFPYVSLRGTIGKTGNDGLKTSWSTTISQVNDPNNLPQVYINAPGNPNLQFEELHSINIGLDVKTRDRRIQLSLDAYVKKANKLLSYSEANPTTGFNLVKSNSGRLSGFGIDANVHTVNIKRAFTWETNGWISYTTNKVKSRELLLNEAWQYVDPSTYVPRKGYPVDAIFAFAMHGLDAFGDPVGYTEGVLSKNYVRLITADPGTLKYIGSATPTLFGSITNTLAYKKVMLSFQLTGKFNYYFRRTSLNANDVYQGTNVHGDYYNRWQRPGDENFTTIPALKFFDQAREYFYQYSETLIEKGDHIRLQTLQILYNWENEKLFGQKFTRLQTGITLNNAGIIWRANNKLDPDVIPGMLPATRSLTVSITASL